MNKASSRSHCIFTVSAKVRKYDTCVLRCKMDYLGKLSGWALRESAGPMTAPRGGLSDIFSRLNYTSWLFFCALARVYASTLHQRVYASTCTSKSSPKRLC